MRQLEWGYLYNSFKDSNALAGELEERVRDLMMDDDVTNKKGIYEYVLSGKEFCLSIRAFTEKMKLSAYERQGGICPLCGMHYELVQMEGDHITPWSQGGKIQDCMKSPGTGDNGLYNLAIRSTLPAISSRSHPGDRTSESSVRENIS